MRRYYRTPDALAGPDLVTDIILQKYDLGWRNVTDGVKIRGWVRSVWVKKLDTGQYNCALIDEEKYTPEKVATLPYGKAREVCMRWLMQGIL